MVNNNFPILTIVISTYNRNSLLQENLNKILENKNNTFRIIVGDNASTDNTWDMLQSIGDDRFTCKRNEKNLGISNVMLLDYDVETKYFINLNDRDYIKSEDIDKLCAFLYKVENFEMCSLFPHKRAKKGKCSADKFINEFYLANHPGYLIYNTDYYKQSINKNSLDIFFKENDMIDLSNYAYIQLLYNLKLGYCYPIQLIQQPKNRDKSIPQTRKELYGVAYVLPEYHMGAIKSLIDFVTKVNYDNKMKIGKLIIGTFDFALNKIGPEYFFSSTRSDFRKRNHMEDASPWKCFHNIAVLTKYVESLESISIYGITKTIKLHGIKSYILMIIRMFRRLRGTFRAIFYRYY